MGVLLGLSSLLADGNGRGGGDLSCKNYEGKPQDPKNYQRVESESNFDNRIFRVIVPKIVGRWAGDRIVITGDYADNGKFLNEIPISDEQIEKCKNHYAEHYRDNIEGIDDINLYTYASEFLKDISKDVLLALSDDSYVAKELEKRNLIEIRPDMALVKKGRFE